MKLNLMYPMIVCDDLAVSRAFYNRLGFDTLFSGPDYVQMVWPGAPLTQIGLVLPRGDDPLVFHSRYRGGMFLAIDVRDVDAVYAELRAVGIEIAEDIRTAPWGKRHFAVMDPNGVAIDIGQTMKVTEMDFNRALEDA